jgi:protein-disulfide isomerase
MLWHHKEHMEQNKLFLPISVLAAGLLIAGAVVYNGQRTATAPTGNEGGAKTTITAKEIDTSNRPFIGKADAPVVMAFWSDFQCPYCKQSEVGGVKVLEDKGMKAALPDIVKNYVETGKVKIVFMDFPFLGPDSIIAAEYGRAVWKLYPTQYEAWRIAMFKAQDDENAGFGNEASIKTLTAKIAGIDAAKVAADVAANKAAYDALIADDRAVAEKAGVSATPTSLVGNKLIAGAYPYEAFKQAIDAQLK